MTTNYSEVIDYLNPVAEKLTGWTLAEAVGRPLSEVVQLLDEATMDRLENPLRRALRENQACAFAGEAALLRRDTTTLAIDVRAAPIHGRNGRVVGGVTVFHDVTAARSMAKPSRPVTLCRCKCTSG